MNDFEESNWSDKDFSNTYLNAVDIFIPERQKMIKVLESFYANFLVKKDNNRILDLGCGDGILTYRLYSIDNNIAATLIDGSEEMLDKARENLKEINNTQFISARFQDLFEKDFELPLFDLAISSLAIHHLNRQEKKAIFEFVFKKLNIGGYFLNMDVVLSPTQELDDWYHELWRKQIIDAQNAQGIKEDHQYVIDLYRDNEENKPDTLETQMSALTDIGFTGVDCYYKYGIYAVFGGKKNS